MLIGMHEQFSLDSFLDLSNIEDGIDFRWCFHLFFLNNSHQIQMDLVSREIEIDARARALARARCFGLENGTIGLDDR